MNSIEYIPQSDEVVSHSWTPEAWRAFDLTRVDSVYRDVLEPRLQSGEYVVFLDCSFDTGGPWAGVSTLFRDVISTATQNDQALLQRHAFELVQVLPHLRAVLTVSNPTLTDLARDEEKVRNYAADRAFRLVHGLINLLDEYGEVAPSSGPVTMVCHRFNEAGVVCTRFFAELVRRRAAKLGIRLLLGIAEATREESRALFTDHSLVDVVFVAPPPLLPESNNWSALAATKAQDIEDKVGTNRTAIQPHLPDLIHLWGAANNPAKVLHWRLYATAFYCNLGLYADALRYADGLVEFAAERVPGSEVLQWWVVNKILNAQTGLGNAEQGLKLAEGEALKLAKYVDPIWSSQLFYLTAMLYSRYSTPRDYIKGEKYLDMGLEIIDSAAIAEEDRQFHRVFNRNGLAMIRSFQGRHDEAVSLCKSGIDALAEHLGTNKHSLHRSILHYNVAQVYSALHSFEEALTWYSAAMAMDPNYSEYYNERGSVYLRIGRLEEAYQDYLKAVALSPPYYEVLTNLGQCQRALGNFSDAITSYSQALDLQPDHLLAMEGRAKAFEEIGRFAEAASDYTAALDQGDRRWEVFANRGAMRYFQSDIEGCIKDLSEALLLAPDQPGLYQNRARALSDLGQDAPAVADLEAALKLEMAAVDREEVEQSLEASVTKMNQGRMAQHA